jgi:uncharacterized protein (TIRG00374 family)
MTASSFHTDKKQLSRIIKILFTLSFLVFIFYKTGLFRASKREQIFTILHGVNLEFLFISILILMLMNISSVVKWRMLLAARNIKVKFREIFQIYIMGKFFNLIFPATIGGDAARIIYLDRQVGKRYPLLASVIIERATGLITLIPLALVVVPFNTGLFYETWPINYSVLIFSGIVMIAFLTVGETSLSFNQSFIYNIINRFPKISEKFGEIKNSIIEYKNDNKAIRWAFINTVIFQILYTLNIWFIAHAFINNFTLADCLVAAPIIMVISNLPISLGGIGVLEFSFIFTLSFFNITPLVALSIALIVRMQVIIDAVSGGFLYSSLRKDRTLLPKGRKLLS